VAAEFRVNKTIEDKTASSDTARNVVIERIAACFEALTL